jgi:hypothetical protein
MSNQTVFALCHADLKMPVAVYATEELAFQALELYAAAHAEGNKRVFALADFALAEARREFSVVRHNVRNMV